MLPSDYSSQDCSIARTLEVLGERWTLLVIRDTTRGIRRFDDFQRSLGIATNTLAKRLASLVDHGVLAKTDTGYELTERGWDVSPILMVLTTWGDRHRSPAVASV